MTDRKDISEEASAAIEAAGVAVEQAGDLPFEERVEVFNALSSALQRMLGIPHPATGVQLVPADDVEGNDYNPNRVAPPEMRLLALSMRKDGMTMPVVVAGEDRDDGKMTVVDGFHRTTTAKRDPEVRESLHGYLPVVRLNKSLEDRITSTVRHNVARGTHQVELTAKLVTALKKHSWSNEKIGEELGMDPDEVLRLKQITGLAEAFADREFSNAWE